MIVAGKEDKELVVDILVSAFAPKLEENSINLIVKQDKKRIPRMRILMAYLFEKAMLFGEVYISDDKKTCLLVSYSAKERNTLKTILLDLHLAIKCISLERVFPVLKRLKVGKQTYIKEDHIRPLILGVKDEYKGRGPGARFMLEIQHRFKDNTLPVIIDAASEKNVCRAELWAIWFV